MKLYQIETDNIYFSGDLHGEFATINVTINKYGLENCAIVVCGDIGIGFEKEEYYKNTFNHISKTLKKKNVHLYMFRGNHDDKSFFDGNHFNDFEYVHIIPDYSVLQTPTRNVLCVGGGTSIDRLMRLRQMDKLVIDYMKWHNCNYNEAAKNAKKLYWEDEAIVFDEAELTAINEMEINIDTICTHTSPTFCEPLTKGGIQSWLLVDPKLEDDIDNERRTCDLILEWLKNNGHTITNWYYGHFHQHNVSFIDGIKYTLIDMARSQMDIVYDGY